MSWPSLSIIIPSFNQGRFVERTLLSILKQDYRGPVQIIVSDGGSTDGTTEVLKRYPQIIWWSERDNGIADAVNKGFKVATGEILAIQSSDDFYLRDAFALTIPLLVERPELSIVAGCDIYLQPDMTSFACSALDDHEITPRSLLMRRVIPQHCAFFRRDVLDRVGGLRDCITEGAEIDFWYRALHFVRGCFVPHHTAAYQFHAAQRTQTGRRWFESLARMVDSCATDELFAARFALCPDDKANLHLRWRIQCAAMAGDSDLVAELVANAVSDERFTDETRAFLALHGFLPKPANAPKARHSNHRVPELEWCLAEARVAA
ncbi:MAG: glycosyltransferase [Tepidisphaeraceae bacterium]